MKDYKKILEGVVNIVNAIENSDICFDTIRAYISENCPELKENEDERIRKEILNYIDKATGCKRWVAWLEKQGKPVEINPTEFDLQLNKLLKQFETLPKEELINSLNFYLNVVQNNGTYKEKKQCEKPQGKSALDAINEEKVDNHIPSLCDIVRSYVDLVWTKKVH